jgi:hypothetical protein
MGLSNTTSVVISPRVSTRMLRPVQWAKTANPAYLIVTIFLLLTFHVPYRHVPRWRIYAKSVIHLNDPGYPGQSD